MTYAAITGWGKCMPPAVLTNQDLATFLDTTDDWIISRTGMKERRISHVAGDRHGTCRQRARAGLCRPRRRRPRPDRLWQLQQRRAGAEQRVRRAGQARCGQCGSDGRQHRVHELPLRPVECDRDGAYRRRAQRAGDRRRADLALHGLEQPQCRRAVRRRLRRRRAAGERASGRTARRAARLLCRRAPDPARARHGLHLREPRRAVWRHAVGLRRPGDLQEGRQGHGQRIGKGAGEVRRQRGPDRSRGAAPGQSAHHRERWPSTPGCRWKRCS